MSKEYNLFIRINYKKGENTKRLCKISKNNNTRIYNKEIKEKKYLIGSGIYNKCGGTAVFKAKNFKEIKEVTKERNKSKDRTMRYDVVFVPKAI